MANVFALRVRISWASSKEKKTIDGKLKVGRLLWIVMCTPRGSLKQLPIEQVISIHMNVEHDYTNTLSLFLSSQDSIVMDTLN